MSLPTRRGLRAAVALLLTLSLAAPLAAQTSAAQTGALQAGVAPRVAIDNFGRINDGYFRGAQPKGQDYRDLAALGVKMVIDLTRDGDRREQGLVEGLGMKFQRIPMTTSDRPSDAAVAEFLALVNDPANQPVYVHCQGGRHRTGVMTAAYRITHDGWTADQAYDEMKTFKFESLFGHPELKSFVFDFFKRTGGAATAAKAGKD